jgi:murein DD-endopeptidase MepM/ murein hydrolase activator NlpD
MRRLSQMAGGCALAVAVAPSLNVAPSFNDIAGRRSADILLTDDKTVIEARVPANATLAGLLAGHSIATAVVTEIVDATRMVFDPRRLRAEHPYRLETSFDGLLRQFRYHIDTDRFLNVVGIGDVEEQRFDVQVVPYQKERALVAVRGAITSEYPSLVAAVESTGENISLALGMAELFAGDIDFNSELQPNDSFDVLFEKVVREGNIDGYGDILAAEFVNEGRAVRAFRYQIPGQKPDYYDAEGRSIRRFFLRSPLKFDARVTSGFSRRRMHPILGTYRPHLAVDYGAPAGAPVVAVANGVVASASYTSGGGNTVHIRHTGGFETFYLHLSSFASGVRAGTHVSQGELIGRVGSTGLATAPHLDYRLRRNGVFVNPIIEHQKMPPGEPIPSNLAADFRLTLERALGRMVQSAPADTAASPGQVTDAQ